MTHWQKSQRPNVLLAASQYWHINPVTHWSRYSKNIHWSKYSNYKCFINTATKITDFNTATKISDLNTATTITDLNTATTNIDLNTATNSHWSQYSNNKLTARQPYVVTIYKRSVPLLLVLPFFRQGIHLVILTYRIMMCLHIAVRWKGANAKTDLWRTSWNTRKHARHSVWVT